MTNTIPRAKIVCLLAAALPLMLHAQADRQPASVNEQKKATKTKSYEQASESIKGPIKRVELCEMARKMNVSQEAAAKQGTGWMEMEIHNRAGKIRKRGWPAHSDVSLSVKKGERVEFYCKDHELQIDNFEKATAPGCATTIDPIAPDSPFPLSVTFPRPKSSSTILGPPVGAAVNQRCYKFSFTVWLTASPTPIDPHLIVKP